MHVLSIANSFTCRSKTNLKSSFTAQVLLTIFSHAATTTAGKLGKQLQVNSFPALQYTHVQNVRHVNSENAKQFPCLTVRTCVYNICL